jgi:hypothetical protein
MNLFYLVICYLNCTYLLLSLGDDLLYGCYVYERHFNLYYYLHGRMIMMVCDGWKLTMALFLIDQSLLHFLDLSHRLFCMFAASRSIYVGLMCLLDGFYCFLICLVIYSPVIINGYCPQNLTLSFERKCKINYLLSNHSLFLQFLLNFIMVVFYLTVSFRCFQFTLPKYPF